ncbi:MAG: ATP-dependent Clp protease ATP-binding subunit [bacterium]
MDNRTPTTTPNLVCPACQGSGCRECRDIGSAALLGGVWVSWEYRIDGPAIAERHTERASRALVTMLLVLFGLLGLASAFLALRNTDMLTTAPWEVFPTVRGDVRMTIFACSLLADLFLLFRALSARERIGRVARPEYGDETIPQQPEDLAHLRSLPSSERLNAATTLTTEAQRVLEEAWELAQRFRTPALQPIFLFAALLSFQKVLAVRSRLGIEEEKLVAIVQNLLARSSGREQTSPVLTRETREIILRAYEHAFHRRAEQLDVTDLFAAVSTADPTTRDLLDELAITPEMIDNVVSWITIQEDLRQQWRSFQSRARLKPKGAMNRAMTAIATPLLDRLSNDLTALAKRGMLHPCIARDREMESVFRLLEGGHNVLLVGNPGVGKSSLIEGIAQRMVTEDVPKVLQDKRLVSLSIAALVGGQGNVEERLNYVLNEVLRAGNIVLFLDNIQNLIGVGSAGGATFDLAEMLSSALASRSVVALATTNPVDLRRYIEASSGLSSAFATVPIEEVDTNAAIKILEAKSGGVEYERKVFFSYGAIEKIVTLSQRYLHDRYLPEKAIGIMEETAVAVHKIRGNHSIVLAEDVARVVAEKTNIAVTEVTEDESAKLLHLEERMHERIIGQDEAVVAVASALRRARVELRDTSRPIANFLFLGPTGVGKTELAKTVADVYFGAEQNMIRLDMSEYQDVSSISRLIGAPPGYRGATEGGYLTEQVRAQPFSLVLLDELEKAHLEILNLFLQVMDDGRLTDSAGRTIDFTNLILIATSNAGTEVIQDGIRANVPLETIKQHLIEQELRKYFRPEFLNRFDQIVVFRPLTRSDVVAVATLMIRKVAQRLEEKGITFTASDAAIRELADAGFDPLFGARPLRRLIQERIDNALAKHLLTGKIGRRDHVILEAGGIIRVDEAPSLWQRHQRG